MRRYFTLLLLLSALQAVASSSDSTAVTDSAGRMLDELVVTAERRRINVIPAQQLIGEQLQRLNSNSVADALRYFAGVQVKDYGGVGGIKAVNIRSMGTNHTGVVYDGVELGNAQNG